MGAAPCLQTSFALNQIGEVSCVCVCVGDFGMSARNETKQLKATSARRRPNNLNKWKKALNEWNVRVCVTSNDWEER